MSQGLCEDQVWHFQTYSFLSLVRLTQATQEVCMCVCVCTCQPAAAGEHHQPAETLEPPRPPEPEHKQTFWTYCMLTYVSSQLISGQMYLDESSCCVRVSRETRGQPPLRLDPRHTHCILGSAPQTRSIMGAGLKQPWVQQLRFDLPPVGGAVRAEQQRTDEAFR